MNVTTTTPVTTNLIALFLDGSYWMTPCRAPCVAAAIQHASPGREGELNGVSPEDPLGVFEFCFFFSELVTVFSLKNLST